MKGVTMNGLGTVAVLAIAAVGVRLWPQSEAIAGEGSASPISEGQVSSFEQDADVFVPVDGQVLAGVVTAANFHVPEGVTVFAGGDLVLRVDGVVQIEGAIQALDASAEAVGEARDASDITIEAGERLTVLGAILGGRGRSFDDPLAPSAIGQVGGAGSDIRLAAPDIRAFGFVAGGLGGEGGGGASGGRGGYIYFTGDLLTDHGLDELQLALAGKTGGYHGGHGGEGGKGVPDSAFKDGGNGGRGGDVTWFATVAELNAAPFPGEAAAVQLQLPELGVSGHGGENGGSVGGGYLSKGVDPIECTDGPDGSNADPATGGDGADGANGAPGTMGSPNGGDGGDGSNGGTVAAQNAGHGLDGRDCCDPPQGPGNGGDGGDGGIGGSATGGNGGDGGLGGSGYMQSGAGGQGGDGGDAGGATAGRGGNAGAGGDGTPTPGAAGTRGQKGTAAAGDPGDGGGGGAGSPGGGSGADGGTGSVVGSVAGNPNYPGDLCEE